MDVILFFLILGVVQGTLEWLPVSSSGNVTLLIAHYTEMSLSEAVKVSFFLHGGTMLSVCVKFRSQLVTLTRDALSFNRTPILNFYIAATGMSAVLGIPIYLLLEVEIPERSGSLIIAFFLFMTGVIIKIQKKGLKSLTEVTVRDALIVGAAQAIAVIPGISRSGMTISAMLSRGITQEEALQMSFLLSIPPVLGLMIVGVSHFHWLYLLSMAVAFAFSLLSMEILLKAAQRLNFSYFCFAIAFLTVLAVVLFY